MWSFVHDATDAVQMVMLISCVLMGLSHLLQPKLWTEFFAHLVSRGTTGLVTNNFLNATPGAIIVGLHQVWSGFGIVLTLYGWGLLTKAVISLVVAPQLGMRSLKMSRHGDRAFVGAGVALLLVGACCALALAGF